MSTAEKLTAAEKLIADKVPERVHAKDASLYNFSDYAYQNASDFMGWTDLASNPPYSLDKIQQFAYDAIADGLDRVILLGEGGSSQAPMTITKLNNLRHENIRFSVLDSLSTDYMHKVLAGIDFTRTIIIVSTKSGGTLETLSLFNVMWQLCVDQIGDCRAGRRFVAVTDPNSPLVEIAGKKHFRGIFLGEPTVGGRFSALSVFGLVPAALVGLDIKEFCHRAAKIETMCSSSSHDNPAIDLANFLYENTKAESAYCFSYLSPQPGRVLGLWIEQLISESLGKHGHGIVPHIEIDPALLNSPLPKHPAIIYHTSVDAAFSREIATIEQNVPTFTFWLEDPLDIGGQFIIWEYATAFLGYLLQVPPFDQPDVQAAKDCTKRAMSGQLSTKLKPLDVSWCSCEMTSTLKKLIGEPETLDDLLDAFAEVVKQDNWISVNAFLPFTGERRGPLEVIRHTLSRQIGVPTAFEVGPRYLHSTGQLQKGGVNNGVFLILSADPNSETDITVPNSNPEFTLEEIQAAQAQGDLAALSDRNRRALHLHLCDCSAETIWKLAHAIEEMGTRLAIKRATTNNE